MIKSADSVRKSNQQIAVSVAFAFVCFASLFWGCSKRKFSYWPQIDVSVALDSIIEIKKWFALGPFEFDPQTIDPDMSFLINDMKQYRIAEGTIDNAAVRKLLSHGVSGFNIDENTPKIRMFNYISDSIENKSNVYLVASLYSDSYKEVTLMTDGSNSYSAWLNGKKLVEEREKYQTNKMSEKFINVLLKEGDNILFVKVNRGHNMNSWDFICAVSSRREAEQIFRINYRGDFVLNPIVNDSLEVYTGPYHSGEIRICDENGHVVANGSFDNQDTNNEPFIISALQGLKEGFYKTFLIIGGETMEEIIYRGDFNNYVKHIIINDSSPNIDDLKAAKRLTDFLNDRDPNPVSKSEIRYTNRLKVFWGYAFHRMYNNADTPTLLLTYDDGSGNSGEFIFHYGNNRQPNTPLMIVVPYALEFDSLYQDWYIRNLDPIETYNALADQYGFALAYIYAGGKNYTAAKTEKEITAVINRLAIKYDIDKSNIFIYGECEGGRRALVQLSLTPEKYAACAVIAPLTIFGGADGVPINLIPLMGNTPVIIKHGIYDEVASVENSRKFVAEAQKLGLPVNYIETNDSHLQINKEHNKIIFELLSKIVQKELKTP